MKSEEAEFCGKSPFWQKSHPLLSAECNCSLFVMKNPVVSIKGLGISNSIATGYSYKLSLASDKILMLKSLNALNASSKFLIR